MLKNLIFLFGFSTFATFVWIGLTIYHNTATTNITPANQINIESIKEEFDTETLNQLKERQEVEVDLSENTVIVGETTNTTPDAESTQSGSLNNNIESEASPAADLE